MKNTIEIKKENNKSLNFTKLTRSGISLIVLVITIIVIIILAAAIIISLNNNNPIMEANTARYESDAENMQAIFTNAVAKIMAKNQAAITVKPGCINSVKEGVTTTQGKVTYTVIDGVNVENSTGTIIFGKGTNTDTEFYTGRELPIYSAGDTKWYVDVEGNISLEVAGESYNKEETPKSGPMITGIEFAQTIPAEATKVFFTDEKAPVLTSTTDVSEKQDKSIIGWLDGTTYKVSTQQGGMKITANVDSSKMFYSNTNIIDVDFTMLDMSDVTDISYMFADCTGLTNLDLSILDTSSVTNMSYLFYGCANLTSIDLSMLDTSSVTDMTAMFQGSGVTTLDLSSFDTSNVTTMSHMFHATRGLTYLDLSNFKTGNVTDMSYMFNGYGSRTIPCELNVSNFDTSNVTTMYYMFQKGEMIQQLDLSSFNTSNVTNMAFMFDSCKSATKINIGENFNTSKVTTMQKMFNGCGSLQEVDVSGFNTSNVKDMFYMFYGCGKLSVIDVSGFDTSNATTLYAMFGACSSVKELNVSNFNTAKSTSFGSMFSGCKTITELDVSSFDTSKAVDMQYMFADCKALTELNVSNLDTSSVLRMRFMFSGLNITNLDVSNFNTLQVTDMEYMFYNCPNLQTLNISGFNTSSLTNMKSMFMSDKSLQKLDLSSFNTVKVTNMSNAFSGCTAITEALARTQADAERLNASSGKPTAWSFVSVAPVLNITLQNNCSDIVNIEVPELVEGGITELFLVSTQENKYVTSFNVNGNKIYGESFIVTKEMGENIVIDNVVATEGYIIESEHNPYPNNLTEYSYGEKTFEGAKSLVVKLEYQTEHVYYDWVALRDGTGNVVDNKIYGGNKLKNITIPVNGNYVKVIMTTDDMINNYYGFKAVVIPVYE